VLYLYAYYNIIARQRLGRNVTAATNTHETTESLLDKSSSMLSVPNQRKIGITFCPELLSAL
jgi:hypothetical protein